MNGEVIVVGAGGHARVCIESLRLMGEVVAVCVAGMDGPDVSAGVPVVRGDHHLERLWREGHRRCFVAIGDNRLRQRLAASAVELGFELVNAIHPHAVLSSSARVGRGVAIMAGAVVNADSVISDLAIINTGAVVDHDCVIGHAVHVAPRCALAGNVKVGSRSFLGIGASVVPGVTIGEDVILGAGSVVIGDIPDGVTAMGVPARTALRGR